MLAYVLSAVIIALYWVLRSPLRTAKSVCVVVLGDFGRSPRMQVRGCPPRRRQRRGLGCGVRSRQSLVARTHIVGATPTPSPAHTGALHTSAPPASVQGERTQFLAAGSITLGWVPRRLAWHSPHATRPARVGNAFATSHAQRTHLIKPMPAVTGWGPRCSTTRCR